jgi:hypothetical protein
MLKIGLQTPRLSDSQTLTVEFLKTLSDLLFETEVIVNNKILFTVFSLFEALG